MRISFLLVILVLSTSVFAELKVVVMNDLNGELGATTYETKVHKAVSQIINIAPDLIILPGDLVSGEAPHLTKAQIQAMWSGFDAAIFAKFKNINVPLAPAPGNHDAAVIDERIEYKRYWIQDQSIPQVNFIDATHFPFYYSYILKNVFFIAMDDVKVEKMIKHTHSFGPPSVSQQLRKDLEAMTNSQIQIKPEDQALEQKMWIQKQLASDLAKSAKARIVYGHIPLYSVLDPLRHSKPGDRGKFHEVLKQEQMLKDTSGTLEEILIDGQVNLAIFAHSHVFYPATIKHHDRPNRPPLRVLFTPCTGPGNRYLPNATSRSQSGFTVIKVNDETLSYEVFTFNGEPFLRNTMPESIRLQNEVSLMREL